MICIKKILNLFADLASIILGIIIFIIGFPVLAIGSVIESIIEHIKGVWFGNSIVNNAE